jgi:ATP-dependent RNA helicase DDX5/DBP2
MQSIPCSLSGRDVIGLAETGSGKTLSYVFPLVVFIRDKPLTKPGTLWLTIIIIVTCNIGQGPLAVILAPTRELVDQIHSEVQKFFDPGRNPHIFAMYQQFPTFQGSNVPQHPQFHKSLAVVGGVALASQAQAIQRRGIDIIVATPGRLIDLLDKDIVRLDRYLFFVIFLM